MIPCLWFLAERFGVTAAYLPLVFLGVVTGCVFLVQAVSGWFEDRNL